MSTPSTLTPAAFVEKWRGVTTTEMASSQSHFIDLCRLLDEPTPHEADPTGEHYAFEKRVTKGGGGCFPDAVSTPRRSAALVRLMCRWVEHMPADSRGDS